MRASLSLLLLAVLALSVPAQIQTLTTTFANNNGQSGNMFDVDSLAPLNIVSLDINVTATTAVNVEVYVVTSGGSYFGNESNAGAWTLWETFNNVTPAAAGSPTVLPTFTTPIPIVPGQMQGIYVTLVNSTSIGYTNGTTEGALYATDGVLNFYEGKGIGYLFTGTFSPRIWNGNIHYVIGAATPEYQTNQPGASLDIDGTQASGFTPATTSSTYCDPFILTWSSAGTPLTFDIGTTVASAPVPLSGGALQTSAGQILNIADTSPTFAWLFGGSFLTPFFPASFPVALPSGAPTVQAQMIVTDASSPEGLWFSQCLNHTTNTGGGFPSLPAVDDGGTTIDLSSICALPSGSMTWYGTNSSNVCALSNGRLMEGSTVDTDFSATQTEAMGDNAFIGMWTDLSPNAGGTWAIASPVPGVVELTFANVGYFGQPAPTSDNSFIIRYDGNSQNFELDNLQGILPTTGTMPAVFLGMSPGALVGGATDPGNQVFVPGAAGAPNNPTDMLYEFTSTGTQPTAVANLVNTISFTPDGFGNYIYFCL